MTLIGACFALVTLGVGSVAYVSRYYANQGTTQTAVLTGKFLPGLVTMARLQESTLKLNSIILQFALGKDDASMNTQKAAFKAQSEKISQYVVELKTADSGAGTQALVASYTEAVQAYSAAAEKFQTELKAGDFEKSMATLDKEVAAAQQKVEVQLRALSEHFFQLSQGAGQSTSILIERSSRFGTVASGALVAVSLLIMLVALTGAYSVYHRMLGVAATLDEGAAQVTNASGQITTSSQSLASGSSEQAASLEETSASLEEMASMTKNNASSAEQAKHLSDQTRAAADVATVDMQEMKQAMDAIKHSSDDISKIIKTIDEIAFQTNILALNAAVEAARAGEAGAGFAVVADEVRNLAQRAAQSAKDTAAKIEDSVSKSEHGVRISAKVAQSLGEIVEKARKVDDLVGNISNASKEQSLGIDQVNTAVMEMDKITQANAAGAEESASAAEELYAQSATLKEAVGQLVTLVSGASARTFTVAVAEKRQTPALKTRKSEKNDSFFENVGGRHPRSR